MLRTVEGGWDQDGGELADVLWKWVRTCQPARSFLPPGNCLQTGFELPGVFWSILLGALRYSCWASFAFWHGFWFLLTEAMRVVLGAGGCGTRPPPPITGRRAAVGELVLCATHPCQPFAYWLNPSHREWWVKTWGHRDAQSEFYIGTVWAFNIRTQLGTLPPFSFLFPFW